MAGAGQRLDRLAGIARGWKKLDDKPTNEEPIFAAWIVRPVLAAVASIILFWLTWLAIIFSPKSVYGNGSSAPRLYMDYRLFVVAAAGISVAIGGSFLQQFHLPNFHNDLLKGWVGGIYDGVAVVAYVFVFAIFFWLILILVGICVTAKNAIQIAAYFAGFFCVLSIPEVIQYVMHDGYRDLADTMTETRSLPFYIVHPKFTDFYDDFIGLYAPASYVFALYFGYIRPTHLLYPQYSKTRIAGFFLAYLGLFALAVVYAVTMWASQK